jgi:hypothetical protein
VGAHGVRAVRRLELGAPVVAQLQLHRAQRAVQVLDARGADDGCDDARRAREPRERSIVSTPSRRRLASQACTTCLRERPPMFGPLVIG